MQCPLHRRAFRQRKMRLHGSLQNGLTAYEYQCGRGVRIGSETAGLIGQEAQKHGIQLSLHAPYFINLSTDEAEKKQKNIGYVLESCRAARDMGADRIVVHTGGVGKKRTPGCRDGQTAASMSVKFWRQKKMRAIPTSRFVWRRWENQRDWHRTGNHGAGCAG